VKTAAQDIGLKQEDTEIVASLSGKKEGGRQELDRQIKE
jgi:hypothetical protein